MTPSSSVVECPHERAVSMKVSEKLMNVIRELGLVEEGKPFRVRRLRAGPNWASAGAWSWAADGNDWITICGSQDTMAEIVKAHKEGRLSTYRDDCGDLHLIAEVQPVTR